ncbi:hypothetical protein P3W24_08230 [Luteibacter sp. PPL201]|uniref:Peptidase M12B domain-containing protein n=1 Tax=Luteibacter sahnii TaxID=3021977 RepID=A0ABT6B9Y9_9GAMM
MRSTSPASSCRPRWLAACAFAALILAAPAPAHDAVARFDDAVARGLPADVVTGEGMLRIDERLRADVTYADNRREPLFHVTWQGEPGVAVRHGDVLRVVLGGPGEQRVVVVDDRGVRAATRSTSAHRPLPSNRIDPDPTPALRRSGADGSGAAYTDMYLYVYVEDGLENDETTEGGEWSEGWTDDDLVSTFFAAWIEQATRDHFDGLTVHLYLRRHVPGVTTRFAPTATSLDDWKSRLTYLYPPDDETPRHDAPNRLNLFLVRGYAQLPGYVGRVDRLEGHYGMASVSSHPTVPSHEIGHLLGERHELARAGKDTNGRRCVTTMWPNADSLFCGHFSAENIGAARETEARLGRFGP